MTLDHWLDIAIHGLAPAAADHVRREYTAAFGDAGEWEWDVLTGWGDPHRVNRELRRVHLTNQEARVLHRGYAPTLAGLGQALREDTVFIVGFALWPLLTGYWDALRGLALGAILLGCVLRWFLVSRLAGRVRWRAIFSWLLHRSTVFGALLLWLVWTRGWPRWPSLADLTGWEALFGTLSMSYATYHLFRLATSLSAARKLEGEPV